MAQPSRLSRVPTPISHFLGYRSSPPKKVQDPLVWLWSFIGAFCGIALLQAVFGQAHYFIERGVPSIVASYGASAVLIYGAIEAPLAQPRALIGGHFIGALLGTCITKLFRLLPTEERYLELEWLCGSLCTAVAIVAMQITSTTHPPAGATALLAATNAEIRDLGWYYLPVVLLSSTLALAVALLINNIQRRYPVFWFEPTVAPQPGVKPPPPAPNDGMEKRSNATTPMTSGTVTPAQQQEV
ncbi:HPP-domain-containing protein [Marasmius fiardii PR-910]|nr:HPP-domain-containing protein [Marasmius fiardii PR-910]